MKKHPILLIFILLFAAFAIPVQAASSVYEIPDMGLSVSIPSSYDVFTLDMPRDDPLFSEYGLTQADVADRFSANNIYLHALAADGRDEIVVTITDTDITLPQAGTAAISLLVTKTRQIIPPHTVRIKLSM